MGKYFAIEVKPEVSQPALEGGNITANKILADWIGFDVPKGAARLIGITARYTGKNGVDYTPTDFDIFWAKTINGSAPPTFGTLGGSVDSHGWFPNIIGRSYFDADKDSSGTELVMGNILSISRVAGGGPNSSAVQVGLNDGLVLQGEPESGTNVGYDKLYCALITAGTHNWGPSTMTVNGTMSTSSPILTVDALSPILSGIGPGDVLRDEDDQLIGTVKSVDSATQITMESNLENAPADNKLVYNTCPITLILSFEK